MLFNRITRILWFMVDHPVRFRWLITTLTFSRLSSEAHGTSQQEQHNRSVTNDQVKQIKRRINDAPSTPNPRDEETKKNYM
jgi:hypothetical protein